MSDPHYLSRFVEVQELKYPSRSILLIGFDKMTSIVVLPIYAALLAILFVYLSLRTIRARRRLGIGLGHAESPVLLRAMRVHANFAELDGPLVIAVSLPLGLP